MPPLLELESVGEHVRWAGYRPEPYGLRKGKGQLLRGKLCCHYQKEGEYRPSSEKQETASVEEDKE